MSKVSLLLLTQSLQSMISTSSCSDSVFPYTIANAEQSQTQYNTLCTQIDRVSYRILRSVLDQVRPRSHDSSSRTKSNNPSRSHCSDGWTGAVVETPGQTGRASRESTYSAEVHSHVPDVFVGIPSQKRKASNPKEGETCKVGASKSCLVRDESDEDSNRRGTDVDRHRVELSFRRSPTKVIEDGRNEYGQPLNCNLVTSQQSQGGCGRTLTLMQKNIPAHT